MAVIGENTVDFYRRCGAEAGEAVFWGWKRGKYRIFLYMKVDSCKERRYFGDENVGNTAIFT